MIFNKEYFKSHKKKIISIGIPLFIVFGLFYCIRFQLPTTVRVVVNAIFGATIKSDDIKFSEGKIEITNVELSYDGQLIGKSPLIEATYTTESLKAFRLDQVKVHELQAFIVRNDKDVNVVTAFVGSKNKKAKKERSKIESKIKAIDPSITDSKLYEETEKELDKIDHEEKLADLEKRKQGKIPGGVVPINIITFENVVAEYKDITFPNEINEKITNISGFVSFGKDTGVTVEATGEKKEARFKYIFKNKDERYWMQIIGDNVVPKTEYIQYGYVGNDVSIWGGTAKVDMTIGADSGLSGYAIVTDTNGKYIPFDEDATNVNGKVTFDGGRKITGVATADIMGNKETVTFSYDGISKFILDASINDVLGKYIKKYETLKNKDIDMSNSIIIKPKVHLENNSKSDPKLNIDLRADQIKYNNIVLDNFSGKILKGSDGIKFDQIKGLFKLIDEKTNNTIMENDIGLDYKFGKEKGEVFFKVLNNANSYISPIEGKLNYGSTEDKTTVAITSNVVDFSADYLPKTGKLIVGKNGKFSLVYDTKEKQLEKGSGVIDIDLGYVLLKLDFIAEDNILSFDNTIIEPKIIESTPNDEKVSTKQDTKPIKDKVKDEIENVSHNISKEVKEDLLNLGNKEDNTKEKIVASDVAKDKKEMQQDEEEIENRNKYFDETEWKPTNEDSQKNIVVNGTADLNKNIMDIKIEAQDFILDRKLKDKNARLKTTFDGTIIKKEDSKNIEINVDIDELSAEYIAKLSKIKGKLKVSKGDTLESEFIGEIGTLRYNDYATYGIKVAAAMLNDKLTIIDLKNQLFNISGDIDLKNKKQDLNVNITGIDNELLNMKNVNFYVSDVQGKVTGTFDSPVGEVKVVDASFFPPLGGEVKFKGLVKYANKKITTKDFNINKNRFTGTYDLDNNTYIGKLNISEDDLPSYYTQSTLRHRMVGTVDVKGTGKDIFAKALITVDRAYFSRNKLPNIFLDAEYKSKELANGIVTIKELSAQNDTLQKLLIATGNVDLKNKDLDIKINNNLLKLSQLSAYTKQKDLIGDIYINGAVKGRFDSPNYSLNGRSNEISFQGIKFNSFHLDAAGDLKKLSLNDLSLKFRNNSLKIDGYKNIKDDNFSFHILSSKIDLNFLDDFLKQYGVTNVDGTSVLDLTLSNTSNHGYLILDNFTLKDNKYYIDLKNLNSKIILDKKALIIDKFSGILDEGTVDIKGKFNNFTLDTLTNEDRMELLDYNVNLKLKDVNYKYGDNFQLLCNSDLNFQKNTLKGNFQIDKGEVKKIPMETRSIYQIIADFLFKSTSKVVNASRDLGSDFQVKTEFENPFSIDLNFNVKDGVILDITEVNAFIGDIKGVFYARGNISGVGNNIVVLGNALVDKGSLTLNENQFKLERAEVTFTDKKAYLPNIDPNINVEAKVNVEGEEVGVGIFGKLQKLRFNISSNSGNSSGDLKTLLSGQSKIQDETTAKLVRTILNDQLSQTFVRPITRKIKRMFGLQKFRIRSSVMGEKANRSRYYEDDAAELRFGAVLEAEDNIYKDKIVWLSSVTLVDSNQSNRTTSNDESGSFQEYDFSVLYRFKKGRSIGIGAGKVPNYKSKYRYSPDHKKSINYHIDFKFEKKYDTIFDILKK